MNLLDFNEDLFLDACRRAQVVRMARGDALLIAGHVIEVGGERADFADLIARALRKGAA